MGFSLQSLTNLFRGKTGASENEGGVVGIDIGSASIKVVQLYADRGIPTVKTYGEIQLGPFDNNDVGKSVHLSPEKLKLAIGDILREAEVNAVEAHFSLSYDSSFATVVMIHALEEAQIANIIPIEARKYVPVTLSEVKLDWFPIRVIEAEHVTKVFMSATYVNVLTQYENVLRESGLNPVSNEHEAFSALRALLMPESTGVAIIDLGASATRLYVVDHGMIEKTHTIPLSGVNLTEAIASVCSVDFTDAEIKKREEGMGEKSTPEVEKTIRKALERGFRELQVVVTHHEKETNTKIQNLYLMGGGALIPGLQAFSEQHFQIPVSIADPFTKTAYPAYLEDTVKEVGPTFTIALGMALRAFEKK